MKDIVRVEIDAPLPKVAELFADPNNSPRWMDDVDHEPLRGESGMPESKYRLRSKDGRMNFTATVLGRELPRESRLLMERSEGVWRRLWDLTLRYHTFRGL